LVKNRSRFTAAHLKAFFQFFCLTLTLATIFVSASFLPKVSKRLKVEFWSSEMVKIGRGQQNYRRCRCRHRLQCFAIRSAMDALRNSKKISLLAVAILFLFTFFTLILDAPRTLVIEFIAKIKTVALS
jgi:hypothetical protein